MPRTRHGPGYYLALTFGTLLSSQGADAHETPPSRASLVACCPTLHRFPAPPRRETWSGGPHGPRGARRTLHEVQEALQGALLQATPRGRNCTLTRGPTGLVVLGMQCSQVRWQE